MEITGQYRYEFIKVNPGKRRFGRRGYWYRCAACGKWCARPGSDRVYIPDDIKMEVDHIRPWSKGGSDELWNLQPLCKPCNRSKSNQQNADDKFKTVVNTILHPIDSTIGVGVRKAARQNKVLKKLGITKRK